MKPSLFIASLAITLIGFSCQDDTPEVIIHSSENFKNISGIEIDNGIVNIENWTIIDSLNNHLLEDEKLTFFDSSPTSFKSASYYYDQALTELYENDNTPEFVNSIKTKYPECIKIEMLPDSSANIRYTNNLPNVSWLLNSDNEIIVDSILYTLNESIQTIEFLKDIKDKPIINVEGSTVSWISDKKLQIIPNKLKSLIDPMGMGLGTLLKRDYAWDGSHRLQAALSIKGALILAPTTYNKETNWYETLTRKTLWVSFRQDRKKWYGWTKKATTFSYSVSDLTMYSLWVDSSEPPYLEGSKYDKEGGLSIFTKEFIIYHSDKNNIPQYLFDPNFSITIFVKSGQVPAGFTMKYNSLEFNPR